MMQFFLLASAKTTGSNHFLLAASWCLLLLDGGGLSSSAQRCSRRERLQWRSLAPFSFSSSLPLPQSWKHVRKSFDCASEVTLSTVHAIYSISKLNADAYADGSEHRRAHYLGRRADVRSATTTRSIERASVRGERLVDVHLRNRR